MLPSAWRFWANHPKLCAGLDRFGRRLRLRDAALFDRAGALLKQREQHMHCVDLIVILPSARLWLSAKAFCKCGSNLSMRIVAYLLK